MQWKNLYWLLVSLPMISVAAEPHIDSVILATSDSPITTINGNNFGQFDGAILSWDDFEGHAGGESVNGLHPISGHVWSVMDRDVNAIAMALLSTEHIQQVALMHSKLIGLLCLQGVFVLLVGQIKAPTLNSI